MRIVCDNCQAKYTYPDELINKDKIRYTCKKCNHVITVSVNDESKSLDSGVLSKWHNNGLNTPKRATGDTLWYYSIDGKSHGPYSEDDLIALFQGELTSKAENCFVWKKTFTDWLPAKEVEPFASAILMPPPPPAPTRPEPDATLPPLFGNKSGVRSIQSGMNAIPNRTLRNSSPDLASLKQRLKTETNLMHEAPTHQAMPALESIVEAENLLDMEDTLEDTTRVSTVSPFFFSHDDTASSREKGDSIAETRNLSKKLENSNEHFDSISSILQSGTKSETSESNKLPSILSNANAAPPLFGGSAKPAPGITSLFSSSPKTPASTPEKSTSGLPRFAGLKKIAEDSSSSSTSARNNSSQIPKLPSILSPNSNVAKASQAPSSLDGIAASDTNSTPSLPANSATPIPNSTSSDDKTSSTQEHFPDFKEELSDVLADSPPKPSAPVSSPSPSADALLAGFSLDDPDAISNLPNAHANANPTGEATKEDSSNSNAKNTDSAQNSILESNSEILSKDENEKSANPNLNPTDNAMVSLPEISLEKSEDISTISAALDSALNSVDLPEIALDKSSDSSVIPAISAIEPENGIENLESREKASLDAISLDDPDEQSGLGMALPNEENADDKANSSESERNAESQTPEQQTISSDARDEEKAENENEENSPNDASNAILTDADHLFNDDAQNDGAARVSHVKLDNSEARRNALWKEIQEQELPDEVPELSEKSQLIQLEHFQKLAEANKRQKRNKFIAVVLGAALLIALTIAGTLYSKSNDKDDKASSAVTVSQTAFDTVKGRTIESDEIDRLIPADDFEIFDAQATKRTKQDPVKSKPTAPSDAQDKTANADAPLPAALPPSSATRKDGRAGVALQKQDFADASATEGSKIKPHSTPSMQDKFKLGLSIISKTVQECYRREAKNGTMNVPKIYISFVVKNDGSVEKFDIENAQVPETFPKCLDAKKDRWKFAAFDGNSVTLRQGFILN